MNGFTTILKLNKGFICKYIFLSYKDCTCSFIPRKYLLWV